MRISCGLDLVVIECRLSATIRFGITNGHMSSIYAKLPAVWQTYPHTGSLEFAPAAVLVEWLITPMTGISYHAPSGNNDPAHS